MIYYYNVLFAILILAQKLTYQFYLSYLIGYECTLGNNSSFKNYDQCNLCFTLVLLHQYHLLYLFLFSYLHAFPSRPTTILFEIAENVQIYQFETPFEAQFLDINKVEAT